MSTGTNEQMITGGELVAKALKAEGVEVIYTLCGGHIIDIYNGCLNEGIKIIDVRHEEVASHAADGYARMTGKPGCAVVTAGPGTTHALTGVANAFRAEIPTSICTVHSIIPLCVPPFVKLSVYKFAALYAPLDV